MRFKVHFARVDISQKVLELMKGAFRLDKMMKYVQAKHDIVMMAPHFVNEIKDRAIDGSKIFVSSALKGLQKMEIGWPDLYTRTVEANFFKAVQKVPPMAANIQHRTALAEQSAPNKFKPLMPLVTWNPLQIRMEQFGVNASVSQGVCHHLASEFGPMTMPRYDGDGYARQCQ